MLIILQDGQFKFLQNVIDTDDWIFRFFQIPNLFLLLLLLRE